MWVSFQSSILHPLHGLFQVWSRSVISFSPCRTPFPYMALICIKLSIILMSWAWVNISYRSLLEWPFLWSIFRRGELHFYWTVAPSNITLGSGLSAKKIGGRQPTGNFMEPRPSLIQVGLNGMCRWPWRTRGKKCCLRNNQRREIGASSGLTDRERNLERIKHLKMMMGSLYF